MSTATRRGAESSLGGPPMDDLLAELLATEADRDLDEGRDEARERWQGRGAYFDAVLDEWDEDAARGAMVGESRQTSFDWRER
jgi:hypothetical protein